MNRQQLKQIRAGGSFVVSRGKTLAAFPYGNIPGAIYQDREQARGQLNTYLSKRQVRDLVAIQEKTFK